MVITLGRMTEQEPVAPGKSFEYRFTPPEPGTVLVRPCILGGADRGGRGPSAR